MIEDIQPPAEPVPTIKLWTPNTIGVFTFFLGFPSGITLASINWFKTGMKWKAIINILIGMIGIVAIYFIPENFTRSVALLINLGFVAYIRYQIKSDIDLIADDYNIENAHWFNGLLASLLGWGISVTIIFMATSFSLTSQADSSSYLSQGNNHYDNGEFNQAITAYSQAIELDPGYGDAYYNRGLVYRDIGDNDRAILDFTQVIKLNSNDSKAFSNRGYCYAMKDDLDQALKDFTQSIQLAPQDADALYNRGLVYIQKDEYDLAISDFTNSIQINPNDKYSYNNRGIALRNKGEYINALADFDKAIQLNPNDARPYYNRGLTYAAMEQTNEAIDDFEKVLEITTDPSLRQETVDELQKITRQ